jgi:hypothetical protein
MIFRQMKLNLQIIFHFYCLLLYRVRNDVSIYYKNITRAFRNIPECYIKDQSNITSIKSFNTLDWLHTLNLAFNYFNNYL